MSFDGMFTHALVAELNENFAGARINKIHQPYNNEIILTLRAQRKNIKVLLSAHPNFARVQVSDQDYVNPDTPPNFCMVLRKFIEGSRIRQVSQFENDRIIIFALEGKDELGDTIQQELVVEMMGRHSNILLIDQNKKILDCIKHIPVYQNTYRTLLPGASYVLPPQAGKLNPFKQLDESHLASMSIQEISPKLLQENFMGLGKDSAQEVSHLIDKHGDFKTGWQAYLAHFDQVKPSLIKTQDNKRFFLPFPYQSLPGDYTFYSSLSELLAGYYDLMAQQDHIKQIGNQLVQVVSKELKKNKRKLQKLQADWDKSQEADAYKLRGELLTTYLYQVEKGADSVTLANYYDDDKAMTIALDPSLTPSQNAQKYYQRYNKLTESLSHIEEQLAHTRAENDYLESVETQIKWSEPNELAAIKEELEQQGYLKKQKQKRKKKNEKLPPRHYQSSDGHSILVGRNNRQNDELSLRQANKNHYWFHTKDIPGSHVILQTDQPSDQEIIEAAQLAAHYSKYRLANNVPVDYTQVKNVKKPNGSRPGFVNYFNQQTVFVSPAQIKE